MQGCQRRAARSLLLDTPTLLSIYAGNSSIPAASQELDTTYIMLRMWSCARGHAEWPAPIPCMYGAGWSQNNRNSVASHMVSFYESPLQRFTSHGDLRIAMIP